MKTFRLLKNLDMIDYDLAGHATFLHEKAHRSDENIKIVEVFRLQSSKT